MLNGNPMWEAITDSADRCGVILLALRNSTVKTWKSWTIASPMGRMLKHTTAMQELKNV
jgi:hypothetical protein